MPGFILGASKEDGKKGELNLADPTVEYYTNFFWDVSKVLSKLLTQKDMQPLLALREVKLPSFTVEEEKIMGSAIDYKFAKKVSYDDVSMTWYDNVGLLPVMLDWMNSIYTPEKGISFASSYKKDTEILCYTSDGKKRQKHTLKQSWPKTIKFSDLSYTSSDIKTVDLTLTYDYATFIEENGK